MTTRTRTSKQAGAAPEAPVMAAAEIVLTETETRTLRHCQIFAERFGAEKAVSWFRFDLTLGVDEDMDVLVLYRLCDLGLMSKKFYRYSYGHTDFYVTDAGRAFVTGPAYPATPEETAAAAEAVQAEIRYQAYLADCQAKAAARLATRGPVYYG
jgi:hypothetical protein